MRTQLVMLLWPLVVLLTLGAAFTVYVFLQAPRHYWLKFLMIPSSLAIGIASTLLIVLTLGYAVPVTPPDTFFFLSRNYITNKQGKKVAIEIWMKTDRTRAVMIPWSKKAEEAMEKAMQLGKGGGAVVMHRNGPKGNADPKGKGDADDNDDQQDDYQSNLDLPENHSQKNPAPEAPVPLPSSPTPDFGP